MKHSLHLETTSMSLHIMAMFFMLLDHMWATVIPGRDWMTCVGRIAFPIFAFMVAEGYFHTHSLKKYVGRLLFFAIISEIPFNLMVGNTVFYPIHQNVLWTFLIGILCIHMIEKAKQTNQAWLIALAGLGALSTATILGLLGMVDYYHAGVYTVLVFYAFRGRKWWNLIGQFLLLAYINIQLLGGMKYEIHLLGYTMFIPQQSFALLALIPIWLYRGKQGPHNKALQYLYYAFYPVHTLILGLLQMR